MIESLTVLIVASVLLLLSTNTLAFDTTNYQLKLVTTEFLSEIEQAQNRAVVTGESVHVRTLPTAEGMAILFEVEQRNQTKILWELVIPDEITVNNFKPFYIRSQTGYIDLHTIVFQTNERLATITFQLGMGRYRVQMANK